MKRVVVTDKKVALWDSQRRAEPLYENVLIEILEVETPSVPELVYSFLDRVHYIRRGKLFLYPKYWKYCNSFFDYATSKVTFRTADGSIYTRRLNPTCRMYRELENRCLVFDPLPLGYFYICEEVLARSINGRYNPPHRTWLDCGRLFLRGMFYPLDKLVSAIKEKFSKTDEYWYFANY